MKTGRKRGVCLFLVACVLWGMVGVLPAAAAGEAVSETTSLEEATIRLSSYQYTYSGTSKIPGVEVFVGMIELTKNQDYEVKYSNNVEVGTATVTATGIGRYTGTVQTTFKIIPRKISATCFLFNEGVTCMKPYDGTRDGILNVKVSLPTGEVTTSIKATYEDQYRGDRKKVSVKKEDIVVSGPEGKNYEVTGTEDKIFYIGQITAKELPEELRKIPVPVEIAEKHERDLKEEIPEPWKGTATFSIEKNDEEEATKSGCTLSGSTLIAGENRTSFRVYAVVEGKDENEDGKEEYASGVITFEVKIVEKESQNPTDPDVTDPEDPNDKGDGGDPEDPPPPHTTEDQGNFSIECPRTMTYGESVRLKTTGGKGNGEVKFSIKERDDWGWATIDQQGMLTATQAGKVLVCAEKAGDDRYKPVKANPIEVTIQPATVTIQVKNKTAKVGDPAPALDHTDYTIKGLVAGDQMVSLPTLYYAPDPDMTQEGRISILASGAVVPAGGNYHSQITCLGGTLVVEKGKDPDEGKKPEPTPDLAHAITIRQPENGTVKADCRKARKGEEVILTTTPAKGYVLEKLTVRSQGKTLALWQEENGRHTFTMPDQEVTVSALFAEKPKEPEKPVQPQEPEPPKELPFLDVGGVDWYYEDVNYVYRQELMEGTRSFTFSPHNLCTRGMLVTILYRMDGSPEGAKWSPFQDVPAEAYYSAAVSWAAWNGIASGYDAARFGPNDPISREQLATILHRYGTYRKWDLPGSGDLSWFLDWKESHAYARQALSWAVEEGLLKGMGQGVLDPGGPATRAQLAALLHRFHAQYLGA